MVEGRREGSVVGAVNNRGQMMVGLASRSELAQSTKQRPRQASFLQSSKGETRVAALLLLLALTVHVPPARAPTALLTVHVIAASAFVHVVTIGSGSALLVRQQQQSCLQGS